jgi:galactokinase
MNQALQLKGLSGIYHTRFTGRPTAVVHAPGRVNLIGEHIDYVGLPVFPVGLQKRVTMVLRPREDEVISISNVRPEFGDREFIIGPGLRRLSDGDWINYLMAPAWRLARAHGPLRGFDAVLDSDIPVAAGLSSSAALVVAVGLAIVEINALSYEPLELAEVMAAAEHFVGTRGGGMDQAICLGAQQGHAARIDFKPLRVATVELPTGWAFVVANSMIRAEKSAGAMQAYNRRTSECDEALARVRVRLDERSTTGYPQLLSRHDVIELFTLAEQALDPLLLRRFRHVVTEGVRVRRAVTAMEEGDLGLFGNLMDASHESLRSDYEVSCPELDELCERARSGGAAGARLTGAGFGGCIVALCASEQVERVLDSLDGFYTDRTWEGAAGPQGSPQHFPALDDLRFRVEPSAGASYRALDEVGMAPGR